MDLLLAYHEGQGQKFNKPLLEQKQLINSLT